MKVLIENSHVFSYATGDPQVHGGAERQQWLLARALAAASHDIVVYGHAQEPRDDAVVEGVRFRWVRLSVRASRWPKILARERPDWWYWRCADHGLGLLVPFVRLYRTQLAFACAHDLDCIPRLALHRRRFLWPLYAYGLLSADRILVQHPAQKDLLSGPLRPKSRLVPSIATPRGARGPREDHVAWVALLRETKRPHLLVDVARRVPGVRFVACGGTTRTRTRPAYTKATLEALRSCPNVDYRGHVPPAEAERVIGSASALLSTSSAEGIPNTFLQAWEAGVPVVILGPDPGGIVAASSGGIVAGTVDEAAEAVTRLVADRDLGARLGANGTAYIRRMHGPDEAVRRFVAALSDARAD